MKILIYANCQGEAIKKLLQTQNLKLNITHVSNYNCIHKNIPISIDLINQQDLFLYQPIKRERGKHSTDYILSNINQKIKCISFPYLYNTGMWCMVLNNNNLKNGFNNSYVDFNENTRISGLNQIKNYYNIDTLINDFYEEKIDFNLKFRFIESLNKLKNIEKNTDIKICDFILKNYKKIQMFYRDCHPSVDLMVEITKQICKKINIEFTEKDIYDVSEFNMLTNGYIPITPYERKELGLEFKISNFFKKINDDWKNYYKNLLKKIPLKKVPLKKIISFSLWGKMRLYCIGAIKNAILAKKFFPSWICRFYYDKSVPEIIINKLKELDNTELVFIEKESGGKVYKDNGQFGMFWRFFPFNDNDVEVWMARDIDSRISEYEAEEINKFLKTDKILHSIRNNNEPPCRGGITSFRNYVNSIDTRQISKDKKLDLFEMIQNIDRDNCPFYTDENFLNNCLYKRYSNFYLSSPRTFTKKQLDCVGPYTGSVLDEYDQILDKDRTTDFNYQTNYDDLDILIKNYLSII